MNSSVDTSPSDRSLANLTGPQERGKDNISPIAQVKRMQRAIYLRSQEQDVDNRELAQLACAWERLEERKRVMMGKPAPKPIDLTERKRKSRSIQAASGPTPVPTSPQTPPLA